MRKNLLQYDDVMNGQRRVIFDQRKDVMIADDIQAVVADMRHEVVDELVAKFIPPSAMPEEWDLQGLHEETLRVLSLDLPYKAWAAEEGIADEEMKERITQAIDRKMAEKAANFGPDFMRRIEKSLVLQTIDNGWRDHLASLDYLRAGVNLRAYGQKQPLLEYQREAFTMFQTMMSSLRERVTMILSRVELKPQDDVAPQPPPAVQGAAPMRAAVDDLSSRRAPAAAVPASQRDPSNPTTWGKVARNEPCPCGSGKKFKHCHGEVAAIAT